MVFDDQSDLFASLILPRFGRFVVQGFDGDKPRSTLSVTAHKEIAPLMRANLARNWDCYFTLSAHLPNTHGKTQPTVQYLRALWLDIDVGKTDTAVQSQLEALAEVQRLTIELCIPDPSVIVSSGGGLHVYWALDTELTHTEWTAYARNFKAAVQAVAPKLCADMSTWTVSTSVLRWPGTLNFKRATPRPVEILGGSFQRCALLKDFNWMRPTAEQLAAAPQRLTNANIAPKPGEETPFDKRPRISRKLMEASCPAVREYIRQESETGTHYDLWFAAIRLAAYTTEMLDAANHWSQGPKYEPADVEQKFLHVVNMRRSEGKGEQGPTTCDTLCQQLGYGQRREELCAGCPLFGKNSSPAHLSRVAPLPKIASKAVADVDGAPTLLNDGAEIPRLITGADGFDTIFVLIDKGLHGEGQLHYKYTDDKGSPQSGALLDAPFWFVGSISGGEKGLLYFGYRLGVDGRPTRIVVRARELASSRTARAALKGIGVEVLVGDTREGWDVLQKYLRGIIEYVRLNHRDPTEQLGWQAGPNRSMAIGGIVVDKHGFQPYEPVGTLAERPDVLVRGSSVEAIAALQQFHRAATPLTQVLVLTSFASPLANMAGSPGILISVYGRSGIGKTAVLRFLTDIWASRNVALPSGRSTVKGLESLRTTAGSLMFAYEETGARGGEGAFNLAFGVTDATNRAAVDVTTGRNRRVMPMPTDGYVLSASNSSVIEAAGRAGLTAEREAALARVIEFRHEDYMFELVPGDEARALMEANQGMVGLVYAKYLIDNYDAVKARLVYHFKRISAQASDGTRRFVFHWYAAAMTAAEILTSQGLLNYADEDGTLSSLEHALRGYVAQDAARKNAMQVNARDVLSQLVTELTGYEAVFAAPTAPGVPPQCQQTPQPGRPVKMHVYRQSTGGQRVIIPVKVIVDTLRDKFGERSGQGFAEIMRRGIEQGVVEAATNGRSHRPDPSKAKTFYHSMSPYGISPPVECVQVKF